MKINLTAIFAIALVLSACGQMQTTEPATAEVAPIYEIEQVVGNLYRGRSNNHYTLFLVTSEGVVLADPISVGFSEWLKAELAERFDEEVKYVLYSHHHWDHASGGGVFLDTAEFVGHENMVKHLQAPLPSNQVAADVNGDNLLQRSEVGGGTLANFDNLDRNGDGNLSGAEINADIIMPTTTYSDSHNVYLAGWQITMTHAGNNHSDDGSIINFGEEATAFAVDWLNVRRLPGGLSGQPAADWIDSMDRMANMRMTHVVPGHGERGRLQDLMDYRQFFVDMDEAAREAIAEGVSMEDFQQNLSLEAYSDWDRYDTHLSINAADFYRMAAQDL